MAFTPLDPTKAEVRVVGEAPNQALDIYIPRGAKGEPGGLISTTVPNNTDIDQYQTVGTYSVSAGTDAGASAIAHLPTHESGTLLVTYSQIGNIQIQTYITNTKGMYVRRRFSAAWSAWRHFGPTRTSEAAGRSMYAWDEINQREQLIYGDTGLRDVKADIASGTANVMSLRREGNTVHFRLVTWAKDAAGVGNETIYSLPNGFRPDATLYSLPGAVRGTQTLCQFDVGSAGSVVQQTPLSTNSVQFNASWITNNAWPTSLPGTAVGTIPNT